jgi:hypothetical protein
MNAQAQAKEMPGLFAWEEMRMQLNRQGRQERQGGK